MKPIPKLIMATSLLAMSLPAYSSALWQTLIPNTLNFYEDQSRESIFDIDGDGAVSEGDVFVGFVRLDDRSVPTGDPALPADQLYGVFSIQIADGGITAVDNGDGTTTYDFDYTATTVVGLRLQDLGVTNTDGTSLTAVYEDVNQNLLNSPGDVDGDGQLTIIDFVKEITNDTLDLVAGLELTAATGPADDDHWRATADVTNAPFDPIADLTLLNSATLAGGLPGADISFHAGLGITYSDPVGGYAEDCPPGVPPGNGVCWARLVEENSEFPNPPFTLHEAVVENGDISGAADLHFAFNGPQVNPFFSDTVTYVSGGQTFIVSGAGQYNGWDFYGLSNNADIGVFPYRVPEPATLALMGLGLFGLGAARRRRKV